MDDVAAGDTNGSDLGGAGLANASAVDGGEVSRMLDIKNQRKRAEADVQLLANRLQHLRTAESRARKKIVETRVRTDEIKHLRQRNGAATVKKTVSTVQKKVAVSSEKSRVTEMRGTARKKVADSKVLLEQQRKLQADSTREQMGALNKWQRDQRAAEEARNRQRNAAVRAKRDALRARKQRDAEERERKLRERYEREAAAEQARAAQAEAIIANMEMEERALIERLRQTQDMQREAYDDLQTTLETS